MKYTITILILSLFFVNTALAQTYTGTVPNDLNVTTPTEGSTKFREMNNAVREIKTVDKNLYTILAVGTTTTLTGTSTFIIGSSTTALTLNFPTASTIATSTCTKEYVILNRNTGTVTLNITVEGISGSPTVSQNNNIVIYTDGTTWFEQRVQNAYNAINFGSIGTSSFARSGANSDITSITGLTTYLAIGQGGSGTNTAAGAASAFGVGTEDTPTLTGVVTTGSSTITTLALSNGTVSGNLGISGSVSGLEDADIPPDITLTNITQITNRSLSNMQDTIGFATQTSGFVSIATQTSSLLSLATQTTNLVSFATQTTNFVSFATQTTNLVSLATQTTNLLSFATQTVGLVSIATQTTGLVSLATQTTGNYLKSWTTGSQTTAATGTVHFNSTGDVTVTSTYNSNTGQGTITTALAAGVSAKPDAKVDGVVQVSNPTAYDFPGAFVSIAAAGSDADITFKNPSLATQTSGLLSFATQTTNFVSFATQTVGQLSIGSQTTGLLSIATQTTNALGWNKLTGAVVILPIQGTTTVQSTGTATIYNYQSQQPETLESTEVDGSQTVFLLHYAGDFSNTASGGITWTATGAIATGTQTKFGTGSSFFDGSGDIVTSNSNAKLVPGLHTNWFFSTWYYANVIISNDGIFSNDAGYQTETFSIDLKNSNLEVGLSNTYATATTASAWHNIYVSNVGDIQRVFYNGRQFGTHSDAVNLSEGGSGFVLGEYAGAGFNFDGYLDETIFAHGMGTGTTGLYTENFTPLTSAYSLVTPFGYTSSEIRVQDAQGKTMLILQSSGTATTEASYNYSYASTTVFGLDTNTAIKATSTTYSGWFDGAVRGTAFNIASTEKIKENIKPIEIEPAILEAEAEAKKKYLTDNKKAWITANKVAYTYTVNEVGTGMVTYVNSAAMEKGYSDYIELQWASDLNQDALTANVQEEHGKIFWQKFNSTQPKSWNPKDKPKLTRRGFIVEEAPEEIKGDDKETIDPMAVIAIQQKALQSLKQNAMQATQEIGSLTAALENQKIAYNEEVDNLYKLVNAVIVALLAIGGVSGWATIRRKRKGT